MNTQKVLIIGGPGTGKTTVINHLKAQGYTCFPEISRQVTLQAQKEGIDQLFLEDPILFSQKLLEGRIIQFNDAAQVKESHVFIDRGIPDVVAYMDYIGDTYPLYFVEACKEHVYDAVFLLPPWEAIYESDNERYESFDQAIAIHEHLVKTYESYGYTITEVPMGDVAYRVAFILNHLQ
ncbi:AAA family ATPase [Zhouia sp. PK063]|uniref:AAA family ATPase n=1 Tax=Zhouia sp. PK063 TaxID=3373602 RepID=UPI0037B26077